jgi:hypothetical protein
MVGEIVINFAHRVEFEQTPGAQTAFATQMKEG